jgi:KDO2-lipid IV(A) lauroyltransferase
MTSVNATKILFLYSLRYLIPYLPHSALFPLANFIGVVFKSRQQVKIIKAELKKLFGDKKSDSELDHIAVESLQNNRKDLFEIWSFPRLNEKKIKNFAYVEGKDHLNKALDKGKGALIGVSHFGSWKMIIAALAYEGYKVNQIGLDPRYFVDETQPHHHNLIMDMEYLSDQSLPVNFIYIGKLMRKAYRALAKNEVVIDSFDGFIGTKRIEVPFLNDTNTLALGPILLATRTGAPLLPTFAVRQGDNRHKITIHEEIPLDTDIDENAVMLQATEVYRKILEEYVEQYPSHYCRTLYDRVRDPRR